MTDQRSCFIVLRLFTGNVLFESEVLVAFIAMLHARLRVGTFRERKRVEYVLGPLNMYIGGYRRCLHRWERGTGRRQYVSRGLDIDEDDLIPKIMSNNVLRCTKSDRQVVDPTHGQNTA